MTFPYTLPYVFRFRRSVAALAHFPDSAAPALPAVGRERHDWCFGGKGTNPPTTEHDES